MLSLLVIQLHTIQLEFTGTEKVEWLGLKLSANIAFSVTLAKSPLHYLCFKTFNGILAICYFICSLAQYVECVVLVATPLIIVFIVNVNWFFWCDSRVCASKLEQVSATIQFAVVCLTFNIINAWWKEVKKILFQTSLCSQKVIKRKLYPL